MAYIPPHKRHSKDKERSSPTPVLVVPHFKRNLNLRSPTFYIDRSRKIVYADHAKYRWFAVGLDDNDQFPSYTHLEPLSLEYCKPKIGERPLILVNSHLGEESSKLRGNYLRSPWEIIAEHVWLDLLSSFKNLRSQMEHEGLEKVKLTLVARFCKILFYGSHSVRLESVDKSQVAESILRRLKRSIYTNIPSSYMENIIDGVVPKIGVDFEEEKEVYHVKLSDNTRPDVTVSCKCSVKEDKKLLLYKVELNQARQMVTDISCLDKNLDLRLMLLTKRILTSFTDDEMNSIRVLINSAVLDSDVKGGLRWPLGEASSGGRYSVVWVWHTVTKAYKSPSLRLKVRHANRFDFTSGTGETTGEIYLKLKGIVSELQEQRAESDSVSKMLEDSLKLIWDHFLCCECFLT